MHKHRGVFPELLVRLIEAGEISGTVDTIMSRASLFYEREAKLSNRIRTASVYPILLSVFAVCVVTFLLTFVMPTFVGMFKASDVPLPGSTRVLLGLSEFIRSYWYIIGVGIGAVTLAISRWARSPAGQRRIDDAKLRLPVLRKVTERTIASRFTRTLSALLASGIPMLQALENVGAVLGNRIAEEAIHKARDDIRRGLPLSAAIRSSSQFPRMVHHMIRVGEESGTLEQLLDKAADYYDEELEVSVQQLSAMFEPAMIVTMALIVGFIVISMVTPMFDMVKTVG